MGLQKKLDRMSLSSYVFYTEFPSTRHKKALQLLPVQSVKAVVVGGSHLIRLSNIYIRYYLYRHLSEQS